MGFRFCLVLLVVLLTALTLAAQQSTFESKWQSLKVRKTTADNAIYLFGVPDYVRTDMQWPEFVNHQQRPNRLHGYSLVYLPLRQDLTVFNGPLGRASSASLYFENDRLASAEWTYSGPYATAAYTKWLADDALALKVAGRLLISSKPAAGATLYVLCGLGEKPLTCADEITVTLTDREQSK